MSPCKFIVWLFFLLMVSNLEAKFSYDPKYLKEIIAGYSFGVVGWTVGATSANAIWETEDAVWIGGYSLYGLGASIGVWLTGKPHDEGKYLHTLLGTTALPLLLTGVKKVCEIKSNRMDELIWFSLPIGAFIGYNLSTLKEKQSKFHKER